MEKNKNQNKKHGYDSRGAKIIASVGALLGALLLWIYAIGYDSTLFERTFNGIPVVIEGEDRLQELKGYTLASGQSFSSVTVVAKGKRSELNELSAEDFRAVVNVSDATGAGNQTLNITVYCPNGIEVVSQSSATVQVFIDEFTQRNELLSVSVDVGNRYVMAEGVTFISESANPLSVTVSGPASVIDTIEGAYVNFNLDGYIISENIYGYGTIELRDNKGNVIDNPYVSVSENTAYVSINVTKQKNVPVKVQLVGGVFEKDDIALQLSAESVTVSGAAEVLDTFNELVLNIDETAIDGKAVFEYSIGSLLPMGISNESGISKITVGVTLPKMSVRTYKISAESITVENLPDGAVCKINGDLSFKLIGARDAFAQIDRSLFTATVDFNRVTVESDGSYTAKAYISLGCEYTGVYVQNLEYTVNFTIAEKS